jgi:thioredoxin reductase (NADPH)
MIKMGKKYDLIVLGTGPAGLSAAIYAARYGLKVLILGKNHGGMINYSTLIENYPGFVGSGIELAKKFLEQAKRAGAEILEHEIVNIREDKGIFEVQSLKNEIFKAKAIILASGTEKRKLNIEGEDRFLGNGVSYCTICDAPLFKDKHVAVVGGRNSAAHATLLLAKYAKKVYIIYRKEKLNCDSFLAEQAKQNKKIEIVCNALPMKIGGKEIVTNLVIKQAGMQKNIKIDGIFIEVGSVPTTSLAKNLGLKLDSEGYILVDSEMRTNIKGIFAAGDITANSLKQIIVASAQGAIAAASAYKFLKDKK